MIAVLFVLLALLVGAQAFTTATPRTALAWRRKAPSCEGNSLSHAVIAARTRGALSMQSSPAGGALDDATRAFLDKVVKDNKVVLFMKGTALFPQCGFSNTAVRILDAVGTKFETVNVLDSDKIRNGIKVYSSWPTIPQLYVGGEFVGGSDIMIELYQKGQLAEMIELANAQ
jgi:monothiol glutaredoxin